MKVRISAQPIGWSNDDDRELGGDIPLEQCLREMKEAGYEGTELGHKFPRTARELKAVLKPFGLSLASGWHSLHLLSREYMEEEKAFLAHMRLLSEMGSRVVIVAECTDERYGRPGASMRKAGEPNGLSDGDWNRLTAGLERLAETAGREGLKVAYHHHMGTVIQTQAEIERLMKDTRRLSLLADTGHLAYAGAEPQAVFARHRERIAHVHLKDVRPEVLARARREDWSFGKAVREGVFTVPGDGSLDYAPLFKLLDEAGYDGWLVVEAEQDPVRAHPLTYAKLGREYLRRLVG